MGEESGIATHKFEPKEHALSRLTGDTKIARREREAKDASHTRSCYEKQQMLAPTKRGNAANEERESETRFGDVIITMEIKRNDTGCRWSNASNGNAARAKGDPGCGGSHRDENLRHKWPLKAAVIFVCRSTRRSNSGSSSNEDQHNKDAIE